MMSVSEILSFFSDPSFILSLGVTLTLILMGFIYYYYFYSMSSSSSNSSPPKVMVSTQNSFKYDVFLSFFGEEDTNENFVDHFYHALMDKGIYTYKDDKKIQKGESISDELIEAIEDSKFYIIVFSKKYASWSWCLEELVKIMDCQKMPEHTAYPIFYDVEPSEVRNQSVAVGEAFAKHEKEEAAGKWSDALKEVADLAGWELKNTLDGHKFINKIVQEISQELRSINFSFDEKLVGMKSRVKNVVSSLEVGIDDVRMIGIKGMGGIGKTTLARAVFDYLSADFEAKLFFQSVREFSNGSMFGLKNLQQHLLSNLLDEHVTLDSVIDGKNMMERRRMFSKKVLLVIDDVDHVYQLEALAGDPNWFKPGSRIIFTTRDEQVLLAHRVNLIRDIDLLSAEEAIRLFSRFAFGREIPIRGYEELSEQVVRYAAGLPITVKVLASFLLGKDKLEWEDSIDRLKDIPLTETLETLELSYISLENEYREIFLDIACILKGENREYAVRVLECCGFYARIGLKVLEQRSLITISKDEVLGMHGHIEEMGKHIVRREHPYEPNEHSHLWIDEEIEDILANDMGTEATRCMRLDMSRGNARIVMKGLEKMKKLRYLEVNFGSDPNIDHTGQYFPNSLKYLKCWNYPFLYLPKTFQANSLVGLEMSNSRMVKLWEEEDQKVLKKLKFLSLSRSKLTTFDFTITPNLESLSLEFFDKLVELYMPCQKLKHLHINHSKLITFDLGLAPKLETLSLFDCTHFVKLHAPVTCPNLKFLYLHKSRLRSLDLELIPNLERIILKDCDELVEINVPAGCLKKVGCLNLSGCCRFPEFVFVSGCEPMVNCYSATLYLAGDCLDSCPLHPNSNLPKLQFRCYYTEDLPSSAGNIEKLISFGLCACTDLEKFSDMICSLQCLQKLTLKCNITEFPKDLGRLEFLEELWLYSMKIKHLPDSICMLKRLKSLTVSDGDLLEKLPEDLGQLESLKTLYVSSKKIEYLPDSICMLKRLESLDVTDCCCLGKLPEGVGELESLERLDLWATAIKHLPNSICLLKHLKSLKLGDCALLEKLPEDIGLLRCLKELIITDTGISHLPKSIFGLKGLHIAGSPELLKLYDFPSEIKTTTSYIRTTDAKTMGHPLPTKK